MQTQKARPRDCKLLALLLVCLSLAPLSALAVCSPTPSALQLAQGAVSLMPAALRLQNATLMPPGQNLASAIASPNTVPGINPETILWECDQGDQESLYEVFATNGQERLAGATPVGQLPGYYATWLPYVALKAENIPSNQVLSPQWQSSKLSNFEIAGGKILIKAKHLGPMKVQLVRAGELPSSGSSTSASASCTWNSNTLSLQGPLSYGCDQPSLLVSLRGPGLATPSDGTQASLITLAATGGISYGLYGSSASYEESCTVLLPQPTVIFPAISIRELTAGASRQVDFSIVLKCDEWVDTTAFDNSVYLGIQPSESAYNAYQSSTLAGYENLTYLLSDNYGGHDTARGVGIEIFMSDNNPMTLLSWPLSDQPSGWYRVPGGTRANIIKAGNLIQYSQTFTARLHKIPGETPKPGTVKSTAYVLVKVQ
ncbi:fimbrial protein [Pseudomonas sp. PGPR81]|uniref:fimbrial protein n=1 Tax=Pseudomonas sp. PGPR81 TaxID=2913477 RepID=UPI001EDBAC9F|nr:fimbrial protein [Pseudomonas sp. PGPR81]